MIDRPLPSANPAPGRASDAARAHAVCIEVPVMLHGLPGTNAEAGQAFFEDTRTVLVFAQGAVVRLAANARLGQRVILTNPRTKQQVVCRVVHSRSHPNVKGYVELEFTEPVPGFWGISFPAAAPGRSGKPAATPAAATRPRAAHVPPPVAPAPEVRASRSPHPLVAPPVSRPEAPASAAPPKPAADPVAARSAVASGAITPMPLADSVAPVEVTLELPMREIRAPQFGESTRFSGTRRSRRFWVLAAAAAAMVGAVVMTGAVFRNTAIETTEASSPASPAIEGVSTPAAEPGAASPAAVPAESASAAAPATPAVTPAAPREAKTAVASVAAKPAVAAPLEAKSAARKPLPELRIAAPTVAVSVPETPAAPATIVVSEPATPGVALGAVSGSFSSLVAPLLPPSATRPRVPAPTGGNLQPPRLISSVPPVYPSMARQNRIQGDVVIDASIDTSGQVTQMKVISGPPMLHQAAMEALRRWRYQPAQLNGQPILIQLVVKIQFRF